MSGALQGSKPVTKLQAARLARRLTLERVAVAAELALEALKEQPPTRASLKAQISAFENGRRKPGPTYRAVFREIYRATDEELGLHQASSDVVSAEFAAPIDASDGGVDPRIIDYLNNVLAEHLRAEPIVGPQLLVPAVQSQLPLISHLCQSTRSPASRDRMLLMGARFAEFCGWLFQDLGSPVRALTLTDMAMEYAQEIGDIRLTSYLLSRKANIVGENGEPGHSIGLTNAALRSKHALTPQLRALALRQKARALAVIGERESCLETLEQAMEFASDEPASDEFFASYCTSSYIEMESATCWVELGNADKAISTFERGLAQWPATQERDRGICLSRLATAHAITGQPAVAVQVGTAALSVARATGSMRIAHQLSTLRDRLDPWRKMSDVSQLRSEVAQLPNSQVVVR